MLRYLLPLLFAVSTFAFGVSPADKAALQSQVNALKVTIDALPLDPLTPPTTTPPATSWPRYTPDVMDIDLVNEQSLFGAKLLDGSTGFINPNTGVPGYAIHYGDMSGGITYSNGVANMAEKFSNPSCPPKWGVETNGLHYLESCTDGTKEPIPQYGCATCRLIFWNFHYLKPAQEYYFRYMIWLDPLTYTNDTELGIKQAGLAGDQLELGPKNATGWDFQTYRYGFESGAGYGVVEKMGFTIVPGRWYTVEQHDRVNTVTNGTYNKDGLIEVKVDGKLIWVRNNVQQFGPGQVPQITSLLVQSYHGGLKKPAGILRERHARIAICKQWCGPAQELAP